MDRSRSRFGHVLPCAFLGEYSVGMKRLLFIVFLYGLVSPAVYAKTIVWPDGTQCIGQCRSHGYGTLILRSGTKYIGSWKDGRPHGRGKLILQNGERYEGNWKKGKKDGIGTYRWSSGTKYKGRYKDGLMHGTGTMEYQDGARYVGRWKHGLRHGKGTFTFASGGQYIGYWRDDRQHGTGTLVSSAGTKVKGRWKDGKKVDASQNPSKTAGSSGTGFYVSHEGHVVTNSHVVDGYQQINISHNGVKLRASMVVNDRVNDLAILRVSTQPHTIVYFREGGGIRPGEDILAFGYPLGGLLSDELKGNKGMINALSGLSNDSRFVQMSAPIQPGNSGGPLLDEGGSLVGVVTSSINAVKMASHTGSIPQNVNFAIKASVVSNILREKGINYETAVSEIELKTVDIFDKAKKFTVLVECFQ